MPRVNLLPVRAARRRDTAKNEMFAAMGIVVLVLLGLYLWYGSIESDIEDMKQRTDQITRDIEQLTQDVGKVKGFQEKQKNVDQKLKVIGKLIAKKVGPAHMLDELATILTNESKRVWLTRFDEKKGMLTLEGKAIGHEDVSEFQIALTRAQYFSKVKLESVKVSTKGGRSSVDWKITCAPRYGVAG